jgi:hypothetical protein
MVTIYYKIIGALLLQVKKIVFKAGIQPRSLRNTGTEFTGIFPSLNNFPLK